MAPLPKRRHSSRRQGKRESANLKKKLVQLSYCPKCKTPRVSHRSCPKCGYYK